MRRLLAVAAILAGIARAANVCRDTCNDGGCEYADGCDCGRVSSGQRTGPGCESYVDRCAASPLKCENGGKCVSWLGFAYCDCPVGYHGTHTLCAHRQKESGKTHPRKPSLYYRTKVRPGEYIYTQLVIDHDDTFRFSLQFINDAMGTYTYTEKRTSMTTDEFHRLCVEMGSKDFSMNKNMCDFVKSAYGEGDSKITALETIPYAMPKTRTNRTDVYFNGNKNEGRMGGLYPMSLVVFERNMVKLMTYNFHHLVVDDESSYCLPFVDPGDNCKATAPTLEVKRSENVPVIKMIITPDTEMCKTNMKYIYEWTVVDPMFFSNYFTDSADQGSKKKIDINLDLLSDQDLNIPQYTLPGGHLLVKFKLTVKDESSSVQQYSSNRYMCSLHVSLDSLHAEIVDGPERQVSNTDLVTLDASLSFNPNEPRNRQYSLIYTWYCDVKIDNENCQVYTTTDPMRKLSAPLDKAKMYVFTLTTRVYKDYIESIGNPKEGTAKITLLPNSSVVDIQIKCVELGFTNDKCIKNCEPFSSPFEIVYLLVETNCDNCSFEWNYKEESNPAFTSTKKIRELNTPDNVFIATKRSLDYDKVYVFQVKDSNSKLKNSIIIRTAAKPTAGVCHVSPRSGIAGMTLFTITCSQFRDIYGDDALLYYYYERYENDLDGLGLLIGRGSNSLNNTRLSISGKINVIAMNSFGIFAKVSTSVQVMKSSISDLKKMIKSMNIEFLNGNISAVVQMLSVISDVLLDHKLTDKFSVLFKTISKIPSRGCNFCIEQTILVLHKVVLTYSVANNQKINSANALEISSSLLVTVQNLFEYLKTIEDKVTVIEVERIDRIYKKLKVVIDILVQQVDPLVYKNNTTNSMRYFWSSLENMVLLTQNIAETFKAFGESFVLHQFVFERQIMYKSNESYFWAHMLNNEMLRKHNDTISYNLANELLSNKNTSWGYKIFEIDKKLSFWTKNTRHYNEAKSNIKYVALSAHNQSDRKYLGLIDNFISPASITFNSTETVHEQDKKYTFRVPAVGSEKIEFDKAIVVFRLDMTEIGAIFITIKHSTHALLVMWLRDRRPDFELMSDEKYVIKLPANVDRNFTFQTGKDHQTDLHYIGIFVDVDNSLSNHSFEVTFNMNMVCMQCAFWKNHAWSSEGMEIGLESSTEGTVHCLTYHFSLFSSSVFVLPDLLNPLDEIHLFSTIADNQVCLILVSIIFIVYFILLCWSWIQDKKDEFMGRIVILNDNYVGEDEVYLVTVYTGHGVGSGTTANVCIELSGDILTSRAHWLHSPYYQTLQRSNDDWFLIFTPKSLGDLQSVHVWHDNYGSHPDWYCIRIIVTEIRRGKYWIFEVERWFSLCRFTESIEHTFHISSLEHNWTRETREYVGTGIREKHLWASVFIRHPRSPITRCQRLSVILSTVLSIMLASMIFYEKTDDVEFDKFELRLREIIIAMESVVIEMVITLCVHKFFQFGRSVQMDKLTYTRIEQRTVNDIKNQTNVFKYIMGIIAENKNIYYPVHTEMITEKSQWNYWFIIGWISCIVIYVITAFYIILYGLKFGRIKSLCWLTSITIGILQGAVISKPFKIIMICVILAKFGWGVKDPLANSTYNLTLRRYREKTQKLLQNVEYVRAMRKNRNRYLYLPFTNKVVDVMRERRRRIADRSDFKIDVIICATLILTSLCCLYFLIGFGSHNARYEINKITSSYLERVLGLNLNRRITLDNLKELLSLKLLQALYLMELYNGIPIIDDTIEAATEYNKRGWFGLYNSKLIGGGIRLSQNRLNLDGKNDYRNYGFGWTKDNKMTVDNSTPTPWMCSNLYKRNFLFSKRSENDQVVASAGYELNLPGGLIESRSTLDKHLRSGWLDSMTRRLYVNFQMYNPNTDSVTLVEIRVTSECGILYTISADTMVQTVPASSVIADWDTYAFTVVAACALMAIAVTCLLACAFRRTGHISVRWTSVASYGLLAMLAVVTSVALRQRLKAMEQATVELTSAAGYVHLTTVCRAHTACTTSAAALAATASLKLSTSWWTTDVNAVSSEVPLTVAAMVVALVGCRMVATSQMFAVGAAVLVLSLFCVVSRRRSRHDGRK